MNTTNDPLAELFDLTDIARGALNGLPRSQDTYAGREQDALEALLLAEETVSASIVIARELLTEVGA